MPGFVKNINRGAKPVGLDDMEGLEKLVTGPPKDMYTGMGDKFKGQWDKLAVKGRYQTAGDSLGWGEGVTQKQLDRLNELLRKWREQPASLPSIRSADIIPDATNRAGMGLSPEHVHHIATKIQNEGFRPRSGDKGHDIPILVRESEDSLQGAESLRNWHKVRESAPGFPRIRTRKQFFTSLGNGHFTQSLNCFRCGVPSLFTNEAYRIGDDEKLQHAVMKGIPSLVLRADMIWGDRKWVSEMLNSAHDLKWNISESGGVVVTMRDRQGSEASSHFLNLSKTLDAAELTGLVKIRNARKAAELAEKRGKEAAKAKL